MTAPAPTPPTLIRQMADTGPRLRIAGAFFLLVALGFTLAPYFSENLSFAFYAMLWVVMASALNIMAGFTGYMPFGFVAFYGVGAYAAGMCIKSFGLPVGAGIAAAVVAGMVLSLLFSPTLRLRGVYFGIVSLALATVCRLVIINLPSEITGGSSGLMLAAANDPRASYFAMLGLLVVTLSIVLWLSGSRLGKLLRAIRDDADAAEVLGVNVGRARLKAWVITAALAGGAGGIEAWYTNVIDPEAAFNVLVSAKSIVYAMAGGFGTIVGPVVGALALLGIDDLIWQRFPLLNMLLLGLLILGLITFAPHGLVGTAVKRWPALRRYIA
ncbi:MAG: branched-chain amino acid ABC transporter permease [Ottowia sp.]|uniref:branched-chain amino acid ABC transporter permease n=1 Tax=Ottowia sp. TaxID=1898956 RepID=UPI0039E55B65